MPALDDGPRNIEPPNRRHRVAALQTTEFANDGLDLLIDLKGYTLGARPGVLARRPCARQLSWLGYPGSMGAPFIDYLIADSITVPAGCESHYSERVLRLPQCYQPNDRQRAVEAPLARSGYDLPDDGFVFCALTQTYKITPDVFACWMRLLDKTPGSVLWLLSDNPWATENLRDAASRHGIDASRLIFAPKMPLAKHLARYRVADLALDTLPYGSHTTASDALWAGCPIVALCGNTFAARVCPSILNAAGFPELSVNTLGEYEAIALRMTRDDAFKEHVRAKLTQTRLTTPLFDAEQFTRHLEQLYREVVS